MKKSAALITVLTVVAGIIAAVLRRIECNTIFNDEGLAERGAPISIILIIFCVLFAAVVVGFTVSKTGNRTVTGRYESVFHTETPAMLVISAVLGAAMIAAGYLNYRTAAVGGTRAIVEGAVGLLAALAGVAFFALSFNAKRGKGGCMLASLLVTIFVCFYILVTYKKNAADPVLLDNMYVFLALCFSALASYYVAGFAFDRAAVKKTMTMSFISAFLCIIACVDRFGEWSMVFFIFLAVYLLAHGFLLTAALGPEGRKDAPADAPAELSEEAELLKEFEASADAAPDEAPELSEELSGEEKDE